MDRVVRTLLTFRVQARTSGWRASPPFGTPQTMAVRPVTEIQNRLFWRTGTGRASECWVPVHDVARILRLGSDASAEQRLEGAEPCAAVDRLVLITATSPGQHTGGRCLIGANAESADGFTGLLPQRPDLGKRYGDSEHAHVFGTIGVPGADCERWPGAPNSGRLAWRVGLKLR
jgi:hypothetical protein